jgi:hypothetical protein
MTNDEDLMTKEQPSLNGQMISSIRSGVRDLIFGII